MIPPPPMNATSPTIAVVVRSIQLTLREVAWFTQTLLGLARHYAGRRGISEVHLKTTQSTNQLHKSYKASGGDTIFLLFALLNAPKIRQNRIQIHSCNLGHVSETSYQLCIEMSTPNSNAL